MLLSFAALALSAASRWPMSYEEDAVTVVTDDGNYRWDFSWAKTDIGDRVYELGGFGNTTFYFRVFRALRAQDFPTNPTIDQFSTNVVRCQLSPITTRQQCVSLSNVYDFQFRPKDDDNLDLGLYWVSDGEPFYVANNEFEDWEVEFEFECARGETSPEPIFMGDPTLSEPKLILKWRNDISCPQKVTSTVTPTPGPWNPSCHVQFRQTGQEEYGISTWLQNLNNGRFGHGQTRWLQGMYRFLLFSPCERMIACPWGATCDTPDLTSMWMCDFSSDNFATATLTNCTAYGVLGETTTYKLNNVNDLTKGFTYDLVAQNGHNTHVSMGCQASYPEGHIQFLPDTWLSDDWADLNLVVRANDACPRDIPTAAPMPDICTIELHEGKPDWVINFKLDTFEPINQTVTRTMGPGFNMTSQLLYSPCGGLICPDGYDCGGDEDAMIWLCEQWHPGEPLCSAYGLHKYNLSVIVRGDYIFNGIDIRYRADNHRDAHLIWECDQSLPSGLLRVDPFVEVVDNHLFWHISAKEMCATGEDPTPTAKPRYIPTKPNIVANTPRPLASPNPHLPLFNETHFVIIDMEAIQEPRPLRNTQTLLLPQPGSEYWWYGTTITEWFSWFNLSCPSGWICPTSTTANLWQCWLDEQFNPYCHAVANKFRPGLTIRSPTVRLGQRVHLHYEGDYDSNMLININCSQAATHTTIPIGSSEVTYSRTGTRGQWSFDSTSGYACPKAFETPAPPVGTRPAIPTSNVRQITSLREFINGQHVGLNLKKFAYLEGRSIVGYDVHYHWIEVHFSPWDLIGCPGGKSCGRYKDDQANAWVCLDQNFVNCFPAGDKRYNLTMGHIDRTNPLSGITARYAGGAENYSIQFDFQCNDSVPFGEVHFETLGRETTSQSITIWAHTHEVCPDREWGQIKGGAVFLLIVFCAFIAYFVIGTLVMYVRTGTVTLPNEGIWTEFGSCLADAVAFIVTCGKGQSAAGGTYDTI
jgi:hypothetical protein